MSARIGAPVEPYDGKTTCYTITVVQSARVLCTQVVFDDFLYVITPTTPSRGTEACIEAAKSFVTREGYPKLLSDLLSSAVHNMRIHRAKKGRQDTTLHRFGF